MNESASPTYGQQLGAAIREARTTLGMTQGDVATALGVKRASISLWELGQVPGPLNLTALRELLGPSLIEPAPPMLADERGFLRGHAVAIARQIEDLLARQREFVDEIGSESDAPIEAGATESVRDEPTQRRRKGGQQ